MRRDVWLTPLPTLINPRRESPSSLIEPLATGNASYTAPPFHSATGRHILSFFSLICLKWQASLVRCDVPWRAYQYRVEEQSYTVLSPHRFTAKIALSNDTEVQCISYDFCTTNTTKHLVNINMDSAPSKLHILLKKQTFQLLALFIH